MVRAGLRRDALKYPLTGAAAIAGPGAVLFQREVVTASDPGATIDGVGVDVDDVPAPDFGQWDLPR